MPKTTVAETMSNSEKIKPIALVAMIASGGQ